MAVLRMHFSTCAAPVGAIVVAAGRCCCLEVPLPAAAMQQQQQHMDSLEAMGVVAV
jgi:hypothetical protein